MAEEILMGIANKIKEIIPEAEITEAGEKVLITAEHEIGIKGMQHTGKQKMPRIDLLQ